MQSYLVVPHEACCINHRSNQAGLFPLQYLQVATHVGGGTEVGLEEDGVEARRKDGNAPDVLLRNLRSERRLGPPQGRPLHSLRLCLLRLPVAPELARSLFVLSFVPARFPLQCQPQPSRSPGGHPRSLPVLCHEHFEGPDNGPAQGSVCSCCLREGLGQQAEGGRRV